MTTDAWRADVDGAARAYRSSWGVICDTCPDGWSSEENGVMRASSGIPFPPFNGVWTAGADVAVGDVLAAVDEFAAGDLPWNLQLRPGYPAELDDELAGRGLVNTAEVPFMVLPDPAPMAAVVQASAATYRQVETFDDLDALLSLLERGFGMPREISRGMFPMRLMFLAATWIATDGQDVSTGLGYIQDGWCGVFNVATPEEHRGRGYGGAVTAHTVKAARAAGARGAYLQSSPMGLSVYQRLGFVTAESWQQWMPRQAVEPG